MYHKGPSMPLANVSYIARTKSERVDWLRLARTPRVGPIAFWTLMESYKNPRNIILKIPDLIKKRRE